MALSFADDYSGIIMIYFLKQKSDTLETTKQFLADTAPIGKIKCIRSDNGGEFAGQKFESLLRENKIKHEPVMCSVLTPSLLLETNLPKMMWTYAVMALAYIRIDALTIGLVTGKTPYEALTAWFKVQFK